MKLYNTLTRKKEEFIPIEPKKVKMYACGPTVYNYIHIGNARPICIFDVLRRYFEYIGYEVTFVQNFTDIDDKIIRKAKEEGSDYIQVSKKYIEEYKKDAQGLNVREATVHPLATENMDEIIDIISNLVEKGYAYRADNGDVYFSPAKFNEYGKLSHQPIEDLKAGARIEIGDIKKEAMDFALWKAAKEGEPYWESPFSKGRPGWHIECSAMARKYLGKTIDIHCGGQDLIFPHHENEIAQSECCNGVEFAHYWLHNGYINVDNKKMSKSLNNFFTVREVSDKYGYEPIKYLMISSHYRSPINYSEDIIKQCVSSLERLYNFKDNMKFLINNTAEGEEDIEISKKIDSFKEQFISAMDDDFNTADALSAIYSLIRYINTEVVPNKPSKNVYEHALKLFTELCDVLGIVYKKDNDDEELNKKIEKMIEERTIARKNKDWKKSDEIRDQLKEMNVIIEDTPLGMKWKFAK